MLVIVNPAVSVPLRLLGLAGAVLHMSRAWETAAAVAHLKVAINSLTVLALFIICQGWLSLDDIKNCKRSVAQTEARNGLKGTVGCRAWGDRACLV
eukprot:366117-Chlamydomonas_euryale.AAC.13